MPFRAGQRHRAKAARLRAIASLSPAALAPCRLKKTALAELEAGILGQVVLKSTRGYDKDRQLSNPAFQLFPCLIVYCQVFNDVWLALAFARAHKLHLSVRSGGHSTAGFSANTGGMVLDVSRLCYVSVDPSEGTAVVGAGTNFGLLNGVLAGYGLHTPGGGCSDVCVGGHMQGGGYGFTSREFGMNCDNVLEVLVMLWDGRIVRANSSQNYDLYWAVRGGTGGNFGVLLEITYRLHPLGTLWGFGVLWNINDAAAALPILQDRYMTDAVTPKLGFQSPITTQNRQKVLLMRGMYNGPAAEGKRLLAPLLKTRGASLQISRPGTYDQLNEYLLSEPFPIPQVPDAALEDKESGYIGKSLGVSGWKDTIAYFTKHASDWDTVNFEAYGGAINALPADSSAFVHRDVYCDMFVDVFYLDPKRPKASALKFLDGFMHHMRPHLNGHANQDYPRRTEKNYRWLFFGEAFNTLLWVKQKYDPHDVFHYEQSIKPYPARTGKDIVRATAAPRFKDRTIVYEPYAKSFVS